VILRSLRVILRSLRARIILGALLWNVGLFVFMNVVTKVAARTFHSTGGFENLVMSLIATSCVIGSLLLVGGGLRRLDAVQRRVLALRGSDGERLEAGGLTEIEPLVRDMNELLDHRERVNRRASAAAGDLAHGLKTPLAIVAQETERLERAGQYDSAMIISEQVERMQRQIDYQLARARASAAGIASGTSVEVRPAVERVRRTLSRLQAGRNLEFTIDIGERFAVRCETQDCEEMLGNLLENACKWARSAVRITCSRSSSGVVMFVDDDGRGIDHANRERVLQRGVRADQVTPGSGLGLAIVSELAELYGGSLTLDTAPIGGLRAQLVLPAGDRSFA